MDFGIKSNLRSNVQESDLAFSSSLDNEDYKLMIKNLLKTNFITKN